MSISKERDEYKEALDAIVRLDENKGVYTAQCLANNSLACVKDGSYLYEMTEDDKHLGCPSYPNCDEAPNGCVKRMGDDVEWYGHKTDDDDDEGRVCECGSVKFNLLKSGKTECAKCGKREFQWEEDLGNVQQTAAGEDNDG